MLLASLSKTENVLPRSRAGYGQKLFLTVQCLSDSLLSGAHSKFCYKAKKKIQVSDLRLLNASFQESIIHIKDLHKQQKAQNASSS